MTSNDPLLDVPIFRLPPFRARQLFVTLSELEDWGLKLCNIPSLWRTVEGAGIRVAILDTGIAANHVDLSGSVLAAQDFTGSPTGYADGNGHGTHCAGIVAARQNNTGVVGVAPKAGLLIGKVLDDKGSGTGRMIAAGIRWAIEQRADIISMSLGSQVPIKEVHEAIKAATAAGIFVICAAGNDAFNAVDFPGAHPETIAVGSINSMQNISSFSSRGPEVDVAAPGEKITSCWPANGYAELSGTSMATPFVVGVVALMLAKHRLVEGNTPVRTVEELREHLKNTCIDKGAVGEDDAFGFGLINPVDLLEEEPLPPAPEPVPVPPRKKPNWRRIWKIIGNRKAR